jgi:Na+-transporting NADH:ubiquinone oxidoreductase subunit C
VPSEPDNAGEPPTPRPGLQPNTISGTLIVAVILCLVCSLLVSGAAVALRGRISTNKELNRQRNVLIAAGLFDPQEHTDADVPRLFEQVDTLLVNLPGRLDSGELDLDDPDSGFINGDIDPAEYDPRKAAKDVDESVGIPADLDVAGIRRREKLAPVYIVRGPGGEPEQFVLPIYGKGLWSTLYGFLAMEADADSGMPVTGITYYEHAETPGLGGEVDTPGWKAQWPGKLLLSQDGEPMLDVTKPGNASEPNEVDGISGATITSNGVEGMVNYWLGDDGFGPFLKRYREGAIELTRTQ